MPYAPCPTLTSYIAVLKERQIQAIVGGTAMLYPNHVLHPLGEGLYLISPTYLK